MCTHICAHEHTRAHTLFLSRTHTQAHTHTLSHTHKHTHTDLSKDSAHFGIQRSAKHILDLRVETQIPRLDGFEYKKATVKVDLHEKNDAKEIKTHSCVTWLSHMSNMTYSYVWHDSSMCVNKRDMTHSFCDMTRSYVWHDLFKCVDSCIYGVLLKCNPTSYFLYSWHDSFICVTWLIHMCRLMHIWGVFWSAILHHISVRLCNKKRDFIFLTLIRVTLMSHSAPSKYPLQFVMFRRLIACALF